VKASGSDEHYVKLYLLEVLRKRLIDRCEVDVEFVEDIPPTERGKYKYLEQHLPLRFCP